ncbi:MAG: peptidylprolyl isomerase [Methylococcaceae bacterium]|nr:peptidylprolyl isomerase [Methylococcaceae bacterium]
MLLKIREKSQGVFAWIILIVICVPFALWGIQNYVGGASEDAIASVGDKEFFQNDVNRAYQQYAQNFAGMNIDENIIRQQALLKLIKDEVLLQRVQEENLVIPDEDAKKFIQSLEYFQLDGKFDKKQYKALLNSQNISSSQFVDRIKKAQVMEQYQRSVLDSSFATQYDIDNFFKIQNQQRDVDYVTVAVKPLTETPDEEAINNFYQKHQDLYQTDEQVSIEYISLSLNDLSKQVAVTDEQLKAFYDEQKELYTTKERRKISHILFSFKKGDDSVVLAKAQAAKKELAAKTFEALAAEVSDDTGTAKNGGDLGLFEVGGLEKSLEDVASTLKLGDVSEPVKSAFGYHLLKVTELVPAETKSFEAAKAEVTTAFQRKEAENTFYEMSEQLASVSYENPDNLTVAADAIGVDVQKSDFFAKDKAEGIASEDAVRAAAFSEDVLAGNNSDAIELGSDKLVVLRMSGHKLASVRLLAEVKEQVTATLLTEKAQQQAADTAAEFKKQLLAGKSIQDLATENTLEVKNIASLTRSNGDLPSQVSQMVFKAAKPVDNKPSILTAELKGGDQYVISINKVTEGVMSESDKKQLELAQKNIAKALGEATFEAVLSSLQANADVEVKQANN